MFQVQTPSWLVQKTRAAQAPHKDEVDAPGLSGSSESVLNN